MTKTIYDEIKAARLQQRSEQWEQATGVEFENIKGKSGTNSCSIVGQTKHFYKGAQTVEIKPVEYSGLIINKTFLSLFHDRGSYTTTRYPSDGTLADYMFGIKYGEPTEHTVYIPNDVIYSGLVIEKTNDSWVAKRQFKDKREIHIKKDRTLGNMTFHVDKTRKRKVDVTEFVEVKLFQGTDLMIRQSESINGAQPEVSAYVFCAGWVSKP